MAKSQTFQDLLIDTPCEGVLRITLNRPDARNALRTQLLGELRDVLMEAVTDESVRCAIITGGPKVFAAGADIREMADKTPVEAMTDSRQACWQVIQDFPKPLIAAVDGYCLGGGNELAMMCDVIVAGAGATFGQPEIKLGMIPGAGGTQRLTAAVGKARAMKAILTGEFMSAQEAFEAGLVSEVSENAQERALDLAKIIAAKSPIALRLAKEAVRRAAEGGLAGGFALERKSAALLFATEDRKEGISAFLEKREPKFKGR
ncbi:MAG: enoyl-CoA hydratase/isomerase family protein [Armatimonadetes bacterium]|nr:enoyl-CoA hydratase/isomerase family protein [Armatimonadota bacterium]